MMNHLIGILLIVFGAPLVGILGNVIADAWHLGVGRIVSIGGVLAVLGVAAWFIVSSS
ncbi:hypothetical protein QFZ82_007392 [Streptomyces sp. V4I23]|uniref:hypothetical protein n=1 Tax=Streptomyces sp. V4I23 TaxID=3042282 RepID=UPI00278B2FE6|nr:hypothetical protein [Streptomyces sp. V4I23]MDQ1012907.1 hypothetical protein [Streptomyces sp. V4I23]